MCENLRVRKIYKKCAGLTNHRQTKKKSECKVSRRQNLKNLIKCAQALKNTFVSHDKINEMKKLQFQSI